MKKIIVAVAIVCAAAISQAASFNWTTSGNLMGPNVDLANLSAGKVGNGSTAVKAMTAITWSYTMDLASSYGETDTLTFNVSTWKGSKPNQTLASDAMFKPAEATDPNNIVDYSIVITGTYKDANGADWTFTADPIQGQAQFSSLATLQILSGTPSNWTVSGSAVPEPTSGVLLMLGLAGLALKRKRA